MRRKTLLIAPVLTLAAITAGCEDFDLDIGGERVEAPFHYSYDLQPGGHLDLESFNGSVEIRSWDQKKVDISGVKYARSAALRDALRIDAQGTPSSVTVRVVRPSEHRGNMGAKFVIRVPKDITLNRISTSNGAIRVEDVDGPVHTRTSNGGLTLSRLRGSVDAETTNGGIDLTDIGGNAVLRTSNGHIHADHISGPVEASSSNGAITVAFEASPKNDVHLSTSNSSIEVSMPATSAARLRASTSNGSISTDFNVATEGSPSKNHMEGAINGGGPLLDLTTSNGSIKVNKP